MCGLSIGSEAGGDKADTVNLNEGKNKQGEEGRKSMLIKRENFTASKRGEAGVGNNGCRRGLE